jgi:hypothetical protein
MYLTTEDKMDLNEQIRNRKKVRGAKDAGPMTKRQLLRSEYKYQRQQLINKGEIK